MPERIAANFSQRPLLLLAVAFSFGIFLANLINIEITVAAIAFVVSAIAAVLLRDRSIATVLVCICFVFAGTLSYSCATERNSANNRLRVIYDSGQIAPGTPVEIEGVLTSAPEYAVDGEFLTLDSSLLSRKGESEKVTGIVRIFVPIDVPNSDAPVLHYGSRIRVPCRLSREDEYLNPGVQTRRKMLDDLGIDATCTVKSRLLIEHLSNESVFLPLAWVYNARAKLIDNFRKNLSPSAGGVMIASLLGNKHFLDRETGELFREGGTFHILVISGLHITFIGGLLILFIRLFTRNKLIQFVVTNLILWAYTLAVGADVPVMRAALMFTFVSFAYLVKRRADMVNSLAFGVLVLLAWRPSDLFGPSFQLTILSVSAIVALCYPLLTKLRQIGEWIPSTSEPFPPNVPRWLVRFCETIYWNRDAWRIERANNLWSGEIRKEQYFDGRLHGAWQRGLRYLFEGVLVSLLVQICMLPLSAMYFHRVAFASLALNIWVGVFLGIESFAAVLGALLSNVSVAIGSFVFMIAETANSLMLLLPNGVSYFPSASIRVPSYEGIGGIVYGIYLLPLIGLAFVANRWRPFLKTANIRLTAAMIASVLILATVIVTHPFSESPPDGRLRIDFLDVGQGDSALVTFPNGTTLLVDGGGQFNYKDEAEGEFQPDRRGIGEFVVSEYLWYRGLSSVDHILATHADADHIQGLTDVAKNFSIRSALFGRLPHSDGDFIQLTDVLKARKIPIETLARGEVLKFGEATVEVLYPSLLDGEMNGSANNDSVVIRIVYGNRSFLLTGDIERAAEAELTAFGGLSADVVKVAHHGSRTSSTQGFVDLVRPRYAIISVGRDSIFGHPHAEVVKRWKMVGAEVMTTGERGMITVSTDGNDILVDRFVTE